jgi:hypothetical protein
MTDLKYYIGNTVEDTVMVTPDDKAIYFDTEEEAQFFFDNYLTPEDREIAIIIHCILFYDGGYVNWKEYKKELEQEE